MKLSTLFIILIAAILLSSLLASCTENESSKRFGGSFTIDLPAKTKLIEATWKEDAIWYLHRPARPGEQPETMTFQEKSSFGLLEGSVIFQEH